MGIGQVALGARRFNQISHLPYMYHRSFHLISAKPKQIHVYDTIINPFDNYIWCFTFVCIGLQFALLCIMQHLWSQISGEIRITDYIYEGVDERDKFYELLISLYCFFRFLPVN